ncbi:MAG: c-type cytochrome [Steroidobacteraceae bacterium]
MNPTRSLTVVAVAAAALLSAGAAVFAQGTPTKGEQALKYRKSLYQVIAWNFGPMSAMAQGKVPYDAKEFAQRAERVAAVAPMLTEAYPQDSTGVATSTLKPEMWDNRADFDAKLKDLVDGSAALATAARTGDFGKSKAAFFEAANTCKACHDKYKAD